MHAFGGTTLARKRKKYNKQMTGEVNSALDSDENILVCFLQVFLLLFLCLHLELLMSLWFIFYSKLSFKT